MIIAEKSTVMQNLRVSFQVEDFKYLVVNIDQRVIRS